MRLNFLTKPSCLANLPDFATGNVVKTSTLEEQKLRGEGEIHLIRGVGDASFGELACNQLSTHTPNELMPPAIRVAPPSDFSRKECRHSLPRMPERRNLNFHPVFIHVSKLPTEIQITGYNRVSRVYILNKYAIFAASIYRANF